MLDNKLDKDGGLIHSNQLSKKKTKSHLNVFGLCDVFRGFKSFLEKLYKISVTTLHCYKAGFISYFKWSAPANTINQHLPKHSVRSQNSPIND